MAEHVALGEIDDRDDAPAILVTVAFRARDERMRPIRGHRQPDRPEILRCDDRIDGVQRHVVRRIERLRDVEHSHRAGVSMLELVRCSGRRDAGMIDDVCEAAVRRQHDVDRLPAGRRVLHACALRVDVGCYANPVDDRICGAVVGRVHGLLHVDDDDGVVPSSADEQIGPGRKR